MTEDRSTNLLLRNDRFSHFIQTICSLIIDPVLFTDMNLFCTVLKMYKLVSRLATSYSYHLAGWFSPGSDLLGWQKSNIK